jgi:membrane-bound lytic murein transglycosylase B
MQIQTLLKQTTVTACIAAMLILCTTHSKADSASTSTWTPLIHRMAEDGLPQKKLETIFANPAVQFDPQVMARKMTALLKIKTAPPAKRKSSAAKVISKYVQPSQLAKAHRFLEDYRPLLKKIEAEDKVPPEILVAIMLVETKLGTYLGRYNAFNTLASMALCEDFRLVQGYLPMNTLPAKLKNWIVRRTKQKADWAYEELLAFVEYALAAGTDPLGIPSSPYGAIGMCQFMPSNALRFGEDGDGDGRVDLFSVPDALYSIANYLVYHGWKPELSEKRQRKVIYHYNHSHSYTLTVVSVAERLKVMDKAHPQTP